MSLVDTTSDQNTIMPEELFQVFGTSAPAGDKRINSTKTSKVSTGKLYCTGPTYLYGPVKTPLILERGLKFGNGSAAEPSISFDNDPDTGFYLANSNQVGVAAGGVPVFIVDVNSATVPNTITTQSGDLILDPVGPNIDLTGHTLINVGGITVSVGSPNDVIINDSLGVLSSEPQLAPMRGGTGANSSIATGIAKVNTGTWTFGTISDSDIGTLTNLSAANITTSNISSVGTLSLAPGNGNISYTGALHSVPSGIAGGSCSSYAVNLTTTNAAATTLFTLPTVSGTKGTVYTIRGTVSLGDTTGGANTGSYTFTCKGKNLLGAVSVSTLMQQGSILDDTLSGTTVAVDVQTTNIRVRVTGLAATSINWIGKFEIVSQQF
jgi:hypothetical protein